jgi:Putative adhesin
MADTWIGLRVPIIVGLVVAFCLAVATSQERRESRYTTGPKPLVSITNYCGSITVKASGSREIVVTTVSRAGDVTFLQEQHGNRVELRAASNRRGSDLADYTVLVPNTSFITLRSADGRLHAAGLQGDVILEAATGPVEVSEITGAHVHVKTLGGPVHLANIRRSHLDVHSVSGNIDAHNVLESFVDVSSVNGRITYDGDPGASGDYTFSSHTGDLEISIPQTASVDIKMRSPEGESEQPPNSIDSAPNGGRRSLFVKPGPIGASRFVLRSFRGKIRLKRP